MSDKANELIFDEDARTPTDETKVDEEDDGKAEVYDCGPEFNTHSHTLLCVPQNCVPDRKSSSSAIGDPSI